MKVSDVMTPVRGILHDTSNSPNEYRYPDALLFSQLFVLVRGIQSSFPRSRILSGNKIGSMEAKVYESVEDQIQLNDIYLAPLVEGLAAKAFLSEARDERDQTQGALHQANFDAFFKPKGQ